MPPTVVHLSAVLIAAVLAACAPIPTHVYVPSAQGGAVEYSTCAYNSHVPVGLSFEGLGINTHVHLGERSGQKYIEMQLEIPEGKTLHLQSPRISISTRKPDGVFKAEFPTASLVDSPIINSNSTVPEVRSRQLPPTSLLLGANIQIGQRLAKRNVWFATYISTTSAEEILLTLPIFLVNDEPYLVPPVLFTRRPMVIVGLFNC